MVIPNTAGITRLRIGITAPGGQRAEMVFAAANAAAPLVAVADKTTVPHPADLRGDYEPEPVISGIETQGSDPQDPHAGEVVA